MNTPLWFQPPFQARECSQRSKDGSHYIIACIEAEGRMPIANVYDPTSETDTNATEVMKLGRLFAAAPELLAALDALTDWGCTHTGPHDPDSPHLLLIAADTALAKARGEQIPSSIPTYRDLYDMVKGMLWQWDNHQCLMALCLCDARAAVEKIKAATPDPKPQIKVHLTTPSNL